MIKIYFTRGTSIIDNLDNAGIYVIYYINRHKHRSTMNFR